MEYKFDSYYNENIIYKCTVKDFLNQRSVTEKLILALIRNYGTSYIRFKFSHKDDICEIVDCPDPLFNPLLEYSSKKEHWYHPHKILIMNDNGYEQEIYFSDFCSLISERRIEIFVRENDQKTFSPLEMKECLV